MVWDESLIVVEHLNNIEVTRAVLTQMAIASMFSTKGGDQFSKMIKGLSSNGK